jgi:site-specific recombinase XerD
MSYLSRTPDWRTELTRLEGAYAPSTMRAYRADVEAFVAWCAKEGLTPFPAAVGTVCAFVEAQGRTHVPSTVRRRLYSLRKIHRLLELPDPTEHEDVNLAMRRVRRSRLARPQQARGMTRDWLDRFIAVQPDTPFGLRNRAMLSLGYDLLTRRSELVALRTDDVELRADGTLRVLIRRGKADPFGEGRLAFSSRRSTRLVGAWLKWRGPDVAPLFCAIRGDRPVGAFLDPTFVKRLVKASATAAKLPPEAVAAFSGHSMRVGAAQDLLAAGHDTAAIMRAGGWKSVGMLARYLELSETNVWA